MNVFESIPAAWRFKCICTDKVCTRPCETAMENYEAGLRFLEGYKGPEEKVMEALIIDRVEKRESQRLTESFNANPELVKAFKRGRVTFKVVV